MRSLPGSIIPVILTVCAALFATILFRSKRRRLPLPPGPPGWLIVGSAFVLPREREWLTYKDWSREHGSDILYYRAWGNDFVIINSRQVAIDLLERKSALYADRPRMPMLNDLCGWAWDMGLMPYGDDWKLARKLFTQHFRQSASFQYRDEEARCARELLRDILQDQANFFDHIRLMYGKLIMSVTYGIDVRSPDDPYMKSAEKALYAITAAGSVGTYLVDHIPLLKYVPEWFPGAQFKRDARVWRDCAQKMAYGPFESVKTSIEDGTAHPSVLRALLEHGQSDDGKLSKQQEYCIVSATGTAYEAASETTWSATLTLILAMVLSPDIQRKAQAEIDRVVGPDRFPDFGDQVNLSYVTAISKEVLRWRTPLPLAVPHRVTEDDEYMGYHIPGGATVMVNSWAMLHDETTYERPESFAPERYLTESGDLDPDAPDLAPVFGYGRRACGGPHMAQDSVWIAAASMLWAFGMEKALDSNGVPIEVTGDYNFGLVSYPEPFKCSLRARSDSVQALIMTAGA